MLMRLARQTYVRQYDEFTYLFGKVTAFDQVFRSAGPFFAHITREPKERDAIIDEIVRDYADAHHISVVDPEVGYLLHLLTGLVQPENVLEIGTAIGCSGIYIARAMKEGRLTRKVQDFMGVGYTGVRWVHRKAGGRRSWGDPW